MKKSYVILLGLVVLCSTAFAQRKYVGWSTGYWTTWGGVSASSVNYKCYTHLAYFDGSINMPSTSSGQSFTTACHNNNTKALKTLGGSGAGGSFTNSTTSANLANYVSTLVSAMQAQHFDGLDIDWEDNVNSGQFTNLVQQLSTALAKISPKPLLTYATGMGLAQYAAPNASIADQLNLMSYYDYLTGGGAPIPSQLKAFTSRGVAKNKLGVGYGYGTDNEVDAPNIAGNGPNGNPSDINAKILYAIDSGYGGIMIWAVGSAPRVCDSVTAYYVNKNPTATLPLAASAPCVSRNVTFAIAFNTTTGAGEIRYSVPSAEMVNLEIFNMKGAVVCNLAQGMREPGMNYSVPIGTNVSGISIKPGAYVVKLAAPGNVQAGTVILK